MWSDSKTEQKLDFHNRIAFKINKRLNQVT